MFKDVRAIFFFVSDVVAAANWYNELLKLPVSYFNSNGEIRGDLINVGSVEMFFHPVDEKMSTGNAGQVAYWSVDNFYQAVEHAQKHGAQLYLLWGSGGAIRPTLKTRGIYRSAASTPNVSVWDTWTPPG